MDKQSVLGNNDIGYVCWLCSLTESELNLLMGLKNLVIFARRRSVMRIERQNSTYRCSEPSVSISWRIWKGGLRIYWGTTGFGSNILNHSLSDDFRSMTIEDVYPFICYDKRKIIADIFPQDMSAN